MTSAELEQFYEAHIDKIYRFFFFKVLNREIAEDLTSQCFLKFVREQSKTVVEHERAYLFGIAKYVLLDYLRIKYKSREIPFTDEELSVEFESERPEISIIDHLERILPHLSEKQSTILRMRFIDKLTINEIANTLGKDSNYVSTTQKRAFQRIREILSCTEAPTNIIEEK